MRKYKAYEVTLFQHKNGYAARWRIRDPNTSGYRHYHRVGGPAYVEYSPDGRLLAQTWDLNGTMYLTDAEYQKALEEWLG